MKRHALPMTFVLLVAPFLWGCQEQGSTPLTPVAPENPGFEAAARTFALFTVENLGDVTGMSTTAKGGTKKNDAQIVANDIMLDLTFFKTAASGLTDGATCFGAGSFEGDEAINQPKAADGTDFVLFFFKAKGNNGTPGIKYALEMRGTITRKTGTGTGGTFWLPTKNNPATFTAASWEMSAQGKNHQLACKGSGTFTNPTTIDVERNC